MAQSRPWRTNPNDESWWDPIPREKNLNSFWSLRDERDKKPERNQTFPWIAGDEWTRNLNQHANLAAVIDYSAKDASFATNNPLEVFKLLDMESNKDTSKVLIILQDMSYDWVEMLGRKLSIPRSFFEAHFASPTKYDLCQIRPPLGQDPEYNFTLQYTQVHDPLNFRFESGPYSRDGIIVCKGLMRNVDVKYIAECKVVRPVNRLGKFGPVTSEQLISYWGSGIEGNSWTGQFNKWHPRTRASINAAIADSSLTC